MKAIKLLFAVMLITASLELAETRQAQATPTATFQRVNVRIGGGPRRRYYRRPVVVRRPVIVHRPAYRRWHRGPYRRPYRRY